MPGTDYVAFCAEYLARWHTLPDGTRLLFLTNLSPKPGAIDLTPLQGRAPRVLQAHNASVAAAPTTLGPWETCVLH